MTQAVQTPITTFAPGGAATGPFATGWTYADPAEVQVVIVDDESETVLVAGDDYTVAALGGDSLANGGQVTIEAAAIGAGWAGRTLVLLRTTLAAQPADLQDTAGFRPDTAEEAFDKLTRLAQEARRETARAVRAPLGEAGHVLPSRAAMAGKYLFAHEDTGNIVFKTPAETAALLAPEVVAGIVQQGVNEQADLSYAGGVQRASVVATGDEQSVRLSTETAANLALLAAANGPRYPDVATGVAAVAADAYFLVVGSSPDIFAELYRKTAGVGVKQVGGEISSHAYFQAVALSARAPKNLPTAGLLAQWLFDEPDGDIVENVLDPGTYDIDLALPANQKVRRTGRGVEFTDSVIQTESIPNVRTIVYLARTGYDDSVGFILSAGSSNGSGILGPVIPAGWTVHIGNGWGVHPAVQQVGAPNAGSGALELNRGGYVLVFVEMDAAYTNPIGFLGRFNDTAYRCAEGGLRWAAPYSTQLDGDDRQQIYDNVAEWAARHGVILKHSTAIKQVEGAIVAGESTANAASLTSGLSAADQARRYPNVKILPGSAAALWRASEELILGSNHTATAALLSAYHGPEIGLAIAKRTMAGNSQKELWICKMAQGSTYLAPSNGVGAPNGVSGGTESWNTAEWRFSAGFLFIRLLAHIYRWEQEARLQGVGIDVKLIEFFIGLNDMFLVPAMVPSDVTYQGWLQSFFDQLFLYTSIANTTKKHLPRPHPYDPASNATTYPRVRSGMALFQAANAATTLLSDTDGLARQADNVHWTAASEITITAAGFAWGGFT